MRMLFCSLSLLLSVVGLQVPAQDRETLVFLPSEVGEHLSGSRREIVVAGNVQSIVHDIGAGISFSLSDAEGELSVVYRGVPPDNFRLGEPALVHGTMDGNNLVAHTILVNLENADAYLPEHIQDELRALGMIR
ncbi:hypothetical protein HKCCE3408_05665 [Rhodobacterales bacterium HKCCE3408]|nr:hypothetical protein [Rhodobacterales bacterium HKCCE3408]